MVATNTLFKEITSASGISYVHRDLELIDFDVQALLPHKLSEYCPALAVADVDGNGFDDFVVRRKQKLSSQNFSATARTANFQAKRFPACERQL